MTSSALTGNTSGLASAVSPGLVGITTQTFAGAKTFQDGLAFTSASLSNAQATIMGLKQYLHGTTYNGGIAPTVTCPQAGFAITRAVFIPYQLQDGVWRVRINMTSSFSAATITGLAFTINGVTFASLQQVVNSNFGNSLTNYGYSNNATSVINVATVSGSESSHKLFADVELNAKPTWAY